MPLSADAKKRYGDDWPVFSAFIRFERAGGRCECEGECGMPGHVRIGGRCENVHFQPSIYSGAKVVLTVAHLNHVPEQRGDNEVKAMCQGCHLWYDREHHAESRRNREVLLGQLELPT